MQEIPMEWVDKLFNCMTLFYGERWTKYFDKPEMDSLYKIMWKNGLIGLSYDQIKYALGLCKRSAETTRSNPPHVMEFFRIAKGIRQPHIEYLPKKAIATNPEIQRKAMQDIRQKLGRTIGYG